LGATQISDGAISEAATTATMDAVTTISTTNLGDQISSTPAIALSLFLIMAFTDFLDGHIARTYPSTATVLGTYLDPFADKFFISILSCTLCYTGTLPGMLVGLWVIRDVGMFGSSYWMVRKETLRNNQNNSDNSNIAIMDPLNTPLKVHASFMSKVNTTLQIGLIALGIAGDVPSIHIPPELMTSLIWVTAGTTIVSTLGYLDGSALRNSGNR
jgi:cardiolipin synthase